VEAKTAALGFLYPPIHRESPKSQGRMRMEQLRLESLLAPPRRPTVAFDEPTIEEVVTLMAEAITAVFHAGGVGADDTSCPQP
jgi:hypothetical protein